MLRKFFSTLILFLVYAAQFPQSTVASTRTQPPAAKRSEEIPFEFINGHLISVYGSIGSRTNLQFLLDFGTTYTLLDRTLAKDLERGAAMEVAHFSSSIRTSEVVVPELAVGGAVVRDFHVYLMDISEMAGVPSEVVGIIGMDFLKRQNLTVDFGEMKITFLATEDKKAEGEHSAPLIKRSVGYAVETEWRGMTLKLILSTGVEAVTLDQDRIRERPIKMQGVKPGFIGSNFTATPVSVFGTKEMTLNEVRLKGGGVLRKIDWPAGGDELDGFLPLTALRAKRVTLDFSRGLLLWSGSLKFIDAHERIKRPAGPTLPGRKS